MSEPDGGPAGPAGDPVGQPNGPTGPPGGALAELAGDPARRPVLVALDFDGTVSELIDDPDAASLVPGAQGAVAALAGATGVVVALVSGRALTDLAARAEGVPVGTWLVGSHGAELGRLGEDGPVGDGLALDDDAVRTLNVVTMAAEVAAAGMAGVWIQRKPTTVVVHTRTAAPEVAAAATRQAVELGERNGLKTVIGKDIVELSVHPADKGQGLDWLREVTGAGVVVFAGDDTTDEDAFAVLRPGDIGIKVGSGETAAGFRVDSPAALVAALDRFAVLLAERG